MHSSSSNISAEAKESARAVRRMLPVGAALLLTLLQGCASAPPAPPPAEAAQAEAKAAYLANDYRRTLAIVEPLAIRGEPWAQYTLGYMYYYGRGVTMDREMAKQWIQRAAQQGYGPAQQALQRLATAPPKPNGEQMEAPAAKAPTASAAPAPTPAPPGITSAAPGAVAGGAPAASPPAPPPEAASPAPSSPKPGTGPAAAPPRADANTPTQGQASPPAGPVPAAPAPTQTAPPPAESPPPVSQAPMHESPVPGEEHAANGINGAGWITKQDPQRYTVQLIGAGKEEAVVQFIRKYHLEPKAAYFAQIRDGKPWYTVIYGSFADRQVARHALARLPAAVDRAKPWIRRFQALQAQLGR